jgi:hypothetical protein
VGTQSHRCSLSFNCSFQGTQTREIVLSSLLSSIIKRAPGGARTVPYTPLPRHTNGAYFAWMRIVFQDWKPSQVRTLERIEQELLEGSWGPCREWFQIRAIRTSQWYLQDWTASWTPRDASSWATADSAGLVQFWFCHVLPNRFHQDNPTTHNQIGFALLFQANFQDWSEV